MSTSRRSFIKGLAGVIAAAPVIAQALAAPKPAMAAQPRMTASEIQARELDWANRFERLPVNQHMQNQMIHFKRRMDKIIAEAAGYPKHLLPKPEKWPDNLSTVRTLKPFHATPNA